MIEVRDLGFTLERFQGDLAALASAVFYSGYLLLIENLRHKNDYPQLGRMLSRLQNGASTFRLVFK